MAKANNLKAVERFGEAVKSGDAAIFRELVAIDNVDHDPAPGQAPGPQGYADFFATLRSAFPDMVITPEHQVADEDNIAFAYTLTGTHQGAFMGVAPTGKAIKARGMQISRFENGMMVERWGSTDELGILKQIGAAPVGG